jgi:hypothetical protein
MDPKNLHVVDYVKVGIGRHATRVTVLLLWVV